MEIIPYGGSYIAYEYPEVWVFCDLCQKSHPVGKCEQYTMNYFNVWIWCDKCQKSHPVGECQDPPLTISTGGKWIAYRVCPHCGKSIENK